MYDVMHATGTAHDFDFLFGHWSVLNRRLRRRLVGSGEWEEFAAEMVARPLLDGMGNEDEFRTDHDGGMIGMSFRFFDPRTRLWTIYWADSRRCWSPRSAGRGLVRRRRRDVRGHRHASRAGRSACASSGRTTDAPEPRWEQAFSADGGQTWETNWVMELPPAGDER